MRIYGHVLSGYDIGPVCAQENDHIRKPESCRVYLHRYTATVGAVCFAILRF